MAITTAETAEDCDENFHSSAFASCYVRRPLPKFKMPERSIPKEAVYQIISDELMLDGNPRLNLASFVTTWMEPECDKLMMASVNKNYVDMDEYPVTTELQVVLGDKSEQKAFTYNGITCFKPGSFSCDSTFVAYCPC